HLLVYLGLGLHSLALGLLGDLQGALTSLNESRATADRLGTHLVLSDWFEAGNVQIAFAAQDYEEAIYLAEQSIARAKKAGAIFAIGIADRAWARTLAAITPPQHDEALKHFAASVESFVAGECNVEVARTHVFWGQLCRQRGEIRAAREHFEKAAGQFEASGFAGELAQVRAEIEAIKV